MSVDLSQLALSVDANGFVKADKIMSDFNKTGSRTEQQADRIAKSAEKMSGSMYAAEKSLGLVRGALVGIASALTTAQIIQYADAWTNVENVLIGVSDSQGELITTQSKIIQLTKDTSSSLDATAGLYAAITKSVGELGVSQERVLGVTRTINNLFLAGGKSAQSAAGAITQLNQGLASGALRGDEFNSVAEGAPRILDAVAKYLNISRGALRDFAAEGGITAEILIGALESYSAEAQRMVDVTQRTFSQSAELAKSFAIEYVGASENIAAFSATAGQAFVALASNLDLVADAVTVLAIAFGAKLTGELIAKTQATIASIAATNAQVAAENNAALGVQRRAVAEQQYALSALKKAQADAVAATNAVNLARANGTATQSVAALIVAQNQQAITQARLNGAVGAYGAAAAAASAANVRLASSAAAASVAATAMRGLSAGLALIGGPAGAAILAAGAIYYFATRATEAEKIVKGLSPEVEGLAERFGMLGQAQQQLARNELANQIQDQQNKIAGLAAQLESLNSAVSRDPNGFFTNYQRDKIVEVSAAIEGAKTELSKLQGQFDQVKVPAAQIQTFIDKMTGLNQVMGYFITGNSVAQFSMIPRIIAAETNKVSESYAKLSYEIQKQIDLNGDTSESASLAYDIQKGAIKDMTKAEALRLVGLHKTKEAMDAQKEAADEAKKSAEEFLQIIQDMEMDDLFGSGDGIDPFAGLDDPAVQDAIKANRDEFDALISSVDEFGGAWTRTGSIVADTLGSIMDVMNDYASLQDDLTKREGELAEARKLANNPKQLQEVAQAEKKLAKERTMANIGSYRAITSAASEMFSKESKERKALHALEMTLAAVELAMSAKRMIASAAAGAAKFFEQSGWGGFAGVAAMIATIGAIGGSIGGGGAGQSAAQIQETQGTGSVFGSNDKSESLQKSFDRFQDIAVDQLVELRGIRESLAAFQGGIAQLSTGVITSGLTDQKYINFADQYVGDITRTGTIATRGARSQDVAGRAMLAPLQSQIADIFGFIEDSINAATKSLGLVAENPVWAFISDIGKVSFKDLSGEEIQSELNAIFSQQADLITEFVLPAMKEYQQIGEGLFETLMRVANEQAVFEDAIKNMGISLGNLSSIMRIDVAQSVIQLMGGLEEFSEKTGEYFENFYTEQERMEILGKSLGDAFGALNLAVPKNEQEFRKLISTLDLTTDADQKLFASLMELNSALYQQIEYNKQIVESSYSAFVAAVDAEKKLSKARLDSASAAVTAAQKERDAAAQSLANAEKNIKKSFAVEIDAVNAARDEKIAGLQKELDAAKQVQESAASALSNAASNLESAIQAEEQARQNAIQSQISGYRAVAQEAQRYHDELMQISGNLRSFVKGMSADTQELTISRRESAKAEIERAIAAAKSGNFEIAKGLDLSALQGTEGLFKTRSDRDYDIAVTQGKLLELARITESQASLEQLTYDQATRAADELERQTGSLESIEQSVMSVSAAMQALNDASAQASNIDAVVAALESQISAEQQTAADQVAALQKQLDELTGNNEPVLSIADSIAQFLTAREDLEKMDAQLETAKTALAVAQSMYDAEIAAFDQMIAQQEKIYNSALGISDGVKSVSDAVNDLNVALVNYADISREQQQELASIANRQSVNDAERAASEKMTAEEIAKLRSENKELQQTMADLLKTIADNSTTQLNRDRLNA